MQQHRWKSTWVFALCAWGCATAPVGVPVPPGPSTEPGERTSWKPSPGAERALEALWAAAPFGLDTRTLALASGGPVAQMHEQEMLLFESAVRLENDGRSTEVRRTVWRILSNSPDQTASFTWSPWHQERPNIRARVVSPEGVESWLDSKSIVEGALAMDGLEVSDVRVLRFPLPNARRGSVVELQVEQVDTHALVEGAGASAQWELWSFAPVRKMRFRVEAPSAATLVVRTTGVASPKLVQSGGTQRFELEVPQLTFNPFPLKRSELQAQRPTLGWSTAPSWEEVAQRYRPLVARAFADTPDFSTLAPAMTGVADVSQKVQRVMRWVSERVRYTALHLTEGAIVPTKPSTVLSRGYGDCKDLAVLTAVALRHFGVSADVALAMADGVVPRDDLPGLEAFNHMMVVVNLPAGKRLWLDATAPAFPVGVLPLAVRDQRVLVIAPGTRELVSTPGRAETPASLDETVDIQLAPFADGRARVTLARGGAFEGAARASAGECQPADAHKLAEDLVQTLFGKDPFTATVSGCKSGEGPVTTVAEIARASGVDTGDEVATLLLPSRTLDWVVPEGLRGRPPGTDERNEAQKDDERRQLRERTGLSEDQLEQRAYSFDFHPRVERTYRIHLPPRFVVGSLPSNRTLKLGPAAWTETFRSTDARTVEAKFHFETDLVEWSVEDVKAFRAAYWKRFSENKPQVVARFEPAWLIEEKHAGQAMALARTWLAEQPNDGSTRARVARILLGMGLGDLARQEAERALQSSPDDPLVLMVRGEVARYDENGLRYQPGFERVKALECLRKAHELMPHHTWAAATLADVLERNAAGEEVSSWTPEVEEAAQVLQHMVDANEATDEMVNTLSGIYLRARRPDPLKKLFEQRPGLRDESNVTMSLIHQVLSAGLDGALRRVERVPDPKERFTALVLAYSTLVQMNRFDDATTLLQRFTPGDALAREMEGLRAMNQGLGPVPRELNLSAPEAAARSVFAIFANMGAPAEASRRLASLASQTGRSELDGTSHVFNFVRLPNLSTPFGYLELYHRGQCVTTEGGVAVRVRCDVAENRTLNATSYWVRDGKDLKLESLGRPSQLAGRAWTQAKAGHLDEAGAWIRWLIDELGARQAETGAATLLKEYWTQAKHTDASAVLFASAVAQLTFRDMVKAAPPSALQTLRQGIPTLSGALRRRAQLVLVDALDIRGDDKGAFHALEPVALSENEPWMWLRLASLESHLDTARALARIDKALKKDPTDVDWRKVKADVCLRAGRYGEALETLTALEAEKGSSKGLENNLLWAKLMAGKLDADSERDAARMGSEKSVSSAELHTAALILLERGRAADGAQLATQRQRMMNLESDPPQLLLRARLLQLLGYDEPSHALYAKVGNEDPELSDLRRRFLAAAKRPAHDVR